MKVQSRLFFWALGIFWFAQPGFADSRFGDDSMTKYVPSLGASVVVVPDVASRQVFICGANVDLRDMRSECAVFPMPDFRAVEEPRQSRRTPRHRLPPPQYDQGQLPPVPEFRETPDFERWVSPRHEHRAPFSGYDQGQLPPVPENARSLHDPDQGLWVESPRAYPSPDQGLWVEPQPQYQMPYQP